MCPLPVCCRGVRSDPRFVFSKPFQAISSAGLTEDSSDPPADLNISCPTTRFCAIGDGDSVWTSTAPAATREWKQHRLTLGSADGFPNTLQQVQCTSSRFCFAAADADLLASSNPSGGAWHRYTVGAQGDWQGESCAGADMCAVYNVVKPQLVFSRHPLSGGAGWTSVTVPAKRVKCLDSIAGQSTGCPSTIEDAGCVSTEVCLVLDGDGQLLTTADIGPSGTWQTLQAGPPAEQDDDTAADISCPSAHFCAVEDEGRFLTSADPGGPVSDWHSSALPKDAQAGTGVPDVMACAGPDLCMALDNDGDFGWTTNPGADHPTWHTGTVDAGSDDSGLPTGLPYTVACPSSRECIMLDGLGRVLVGHPSTG